MKKMLNGNYVRIEVPKAQEHNKKLEDSKKRFKAYGVEIVPGHGIMNEIRQREKMRSWQPDAYNEALVIADNKRKLGDTKCEEVMTSTQTRTFSKKEKSEDHLSRKEIKTSSGCIIKGPTSQ